MDEIIVTRAEDPRHPAFDHLLDENFPVKENVHQLAHLVAKIIRACINHADFRWFFRQWEGHGFHVTPVHFYQPIPEIQTLDEQIFKRASELVGVDMNDSVQLALIRNVFPKFQKEYDQIPLKSCGRTDHFHLGNELFAGMDALVAYCIVRHYQPQLIIEVGSGYSSVIFTQAIARNGTGSLICIDPYPPDLLVAGLPHLDSLVRKKVEEVELNLFSQLTAGDILFIDSSHTVKIGGDVNYLFLEVIPRLNPGVIVHVHDISFPFDYRSEWVKNELRFWTEQYLLQAFLAFNSDFEVLLCNSYLASRYLENLKAIFPRSPWWGGGSFWMQRKAQG
ncbi:MAG: class I SAM-dependent methyltransferase [Bryobacteraceae bacterium]